MASRSRSPKSTPLSTLASPARIELVSALGEGPASARELADRLGRSVQSLYYHLAQLEKAGLVRVAEERGEGRERERVFAVVPERLAVPARATAPSEVEAAGRAIRAMLRLTGRETSEALAAGDACTAGCERELVALRGKARLSARQLERANALIEQLVSLFRTAKATPSSERLYAITLVLTPARDASPSQRSRDP
ncbi:MAG: winged helix-turn-helix domain-containing protein [Gemmatimonadota bacterium]